MDQKQTPTSSLEGQVQPIGKKPAGSPPKEAHEPPLRHRGLKPVESVTSWPSARLEPCQEMLGQQEQMRLQAAALQAAANSIIISDQDGRIQWVNKAFCDTFGYKTEEVIGRTPEFLRPEHHSPELSKELWDTVKSGAVWTGEIVNISKDGMLLTEHTTITPLFDEEGVLTHFIDIKQDLSQQKKLEEELRAISAAVEHTDDAIILADLEGNISYANPSFFRLFRQNAASILANPLSHLFAQCVTSDSGTVDSLEDVLQHGWEERLEIEDTAGVTMQIRMRISQVRSASGNMMGFACYLYDLGEEERRVEERRLMEIRLRQAQKLESIGQLAAGIAHEINTPTQFVGDNLHFLGESITDLLKIATLLRNLLEQTTNGHLDAEQTEALSQILADTDLQYLEEEIPQSVKQATDGVARIGEIVKAMKEFSHPGTKDRKLANLNESLDKATTVARNEWKYYCTIDFELDPDLEPVWCLPSEINQVFLNIIVNAAHAIRDVVKSGKAEMGLMTIRSLQLDGMVEIRVSDTGTGIPDEIRERIFDPFFTTKEVGKGTGQGLAIAYDVVVHKHGGELFCESEVGVGTTFVIRLPQGDCPEK